VGDRHVDFLWQLPITERERTCQAASELEQLEQRFEDVGLEYWKPDRASAI
jgi:hypothetical protein